MRKVLLGAAALAIFAASCVSSVHASVVNMTFTGVVDGAFGDVNVGDPFSLAIAYESSSPNLGNSTFGVFNALLSLTVNAGTFVATSSGAAEIQIDNNPGGINHDRFAVVSFSSGGLTGTNDGIPVSFFFLRLDDSTDSVFSTANALPLALSLSSFDSAGFGIFFEGVDQSIGGQITGISTSEVPLPAALPLLATALLGGGVIAWRKKRKHKAEPLAA